MLDFSSSILVSIILVVLVVLVVGGKYIRRRTKLIPLSVNYHFTRKCNYSCNYCFHTSKNSFQLPLEQATEGMKQLVKNGMKKINFSGGEPFLITRGHHVGKLCKIAKDLKVESVSIVSNGSLIKEDWFVTYGKYVDIIAISCDSFDDETNLQIGRHDRGRRNETHVDVVRRVALWCKQNNVRFKLNTVITSQNWQEDFTASITQLDPFRWKVFQCLALETENIGEGALRDSTPYLISDEQFRSFVKRHAHLPCFVEESNVKMRNSYLILDERMQFLDCSKGGKSASKSILDVGVHNALNSSGFDENMFFKRGGKYAWTKLTQCDSSTNEIF